VTGLYAKLPTFYTQKTGAGTLVFAKNGTTYGTVDCSTGTELDKLYSATPPDATSGVHTITASGGPVNVSGFLRLGAASGSRSRLVVMNQSHGGYSLASYTDARIVSGMKQALAIGPEPAVLIALGSNDHLYSTYSQIYNQATAAVLSYRAKGAKLIIGVLPMKWPDGQYTSNVGNTWEGAHAALSAAYRDAGVPIIDMAAYDWDGFSCHPPHLIDFAQPIYFKMLCEGLARI
jgi:hypothetical protein